MAGPRPSISGWSFRISGRRSASKLANLSTRALVRSGNNLVIAGFILGNGNGNDGFTRLGDLDQAFAVSGEDLYAQLILEGPDLLRYSGLRGVQGLGRLGDIESPARDLGETTELLELHMSTLE